MHRSKEDVSPKAVLLAVSSVSVLGVLPVFLFAALFVTIREDVTMAVSELGLATAFFYAIAALSSIPAGLVCERLGARRALRLSATVSTIALVGLSSVSGSWLGFLPWFAVGGVADALSKPASNLGLGSMPQVANLGFIFGIKQSSIPVSTVLSGAAIPLLAVNYGWQVTLLVLSISVALTFALADRRTNLPNRASFASRSASHGGSRRSGALWDPPLVLLMFGAGFGVAAGATMNAFYVESAVDIGMSPSAAGTTLAAAGVLNIITRLSAGAFIDRRVRRTEFPAVGKIMLTGALALFVLGLSRSVPLFATVSIIAFSAAWGWNGMYHYLLVRSYSRSPAAATGMVSLGIFGGATLGPVVFGFLAGAGQRAWAWYILGASLIAAATCLFAAHRALARRMSEDASGPVGGGE